MASGIVVGILTAQHADHIILGNTGRIALPEGLVVERFGRGTPVTVAFSYDDAGTMVVESITRTVPARVAAHDIRRAC
ncbi:MAG TPA: hypothetical protein VN323_12170 [Candidatus Dormibacteraeota bacterium]|jgi:hypothetical protein|nr:hypothetical protein [Candidatus Dormibacteraeota bacterium]